MGALEGRVKVLQRLPRALDRRNKTGSVLPDRDAPWRHRTGATSESFGSAET